MCVFAQITLILILNPCNLDLLNQGNLLTSFLKPTDAWGLFSFVHVLFLAVISAFAQEIVLQKHFVDTCNF